jgi:hypothetical protein
MKRDHILNQVVQLIPPADHGHHEGTGHAMPRGVLRFAGYERLANRELASGVVVA